MGKRRGNHEGSIYQRPTGRWCARISMPDGRRLSKEFGTQREAREWIKATVARVDDGLTLAGARLTVAEFCDRWLDTVRSSLRPKTVLQYEQIVRQHIVPTLGRVKLEDLRADQVQLLYNRKREADTGVRTVRLIHAVLHRALRVALRWGLVRRNVADAVDQPGKEQKEMRALSAEQARALLAAARGHRLEALFHLALSLGLRQGELLGLKWEDVDWNGRTLQVRRQMQYIPGQGKLLVEPKTAAGRRTLSLGEADLAKLREHKRRQAEERLALGPYWADQGLIFPSSIGTPLERNALLTAFKTLLQAAGLPRVRFHDLRHTSATIQLAAGIPPNVVQQRLGHATIDVTLGIYSHVLRGMHEDAARRMDELLSDHGCELARTWHEKSDRPVGVVAAAYTYHTARRAGIDGE